MQDHQRGIIVGEQRTHNSDNPDDHREYRGNAGGVCHPRLSDPTGCGSGN